MPSATRADAPAVLHTPPGFDRSALLGRLNSTALEHSPEYRRAITRTSPLLFGLTYLLHHLSAPETGGEVSLSPLHVDLARAARRWVRQDLGPAEVRDAWVAPRGAAKSTWTLVVLPLWATAHGWRRFVAMFADSGPQARQHLATLRRELAENELLRRDFPDLCEPGRLRGRSDQDTQVNHVTSSGVAFMAKGMNASALGAKHGSTRPDLIVCDDIEGDEGSYSAAQAAARLATLRQAILGMNPNAAVSLAGTVTMRGSIMHNVVQAALGVDSPETAWVREENLRTHYYPAILVDDDGTERSLWPQRWPLEFLQGIRGTRQYAMNFANLPPGADAGYWDEDDLVIDAAVAAVRRELFIDPAVTSGASSDFTGLAVVGVEAGPAGRAVIEWARQRRVTPQGLRGLVGDVLRANRTVRTVRVEANAGGDVWRDVLGPVARECNVALELHRVHEGKPVRFARAVDWWQRGWVAMTARHGQLVEQMLAYPNVAHDDVLDAVVAGLERWLGERPR